MTKKILPMMIGAALAGGMTAAAADVSVFGHIDTSVDYTDTNNPPGASTDGKDTNLNCTTCSIGFKGSEDLGNGLKAIFSIDFQYDTTERQGNTSKIELTPSSPLGSYLGLTTTTTLGTVATDNAITDRDQWLGLSGGFGKVRIGTISTGYKSHGAMLDPLYRTSLQGREHGLQTKRFHSGAGEESQGRATNTFRWDSPSWNGVNVVAHYTLDNDEGDGEDDNPYGIGASYENGGILVFADYITSDGSTSTGNDVDSWKLGGKYTMNNFAVMGQYEAWSNNSADNTQWMVSGSYTLGSNLLYAGYGNATNENQSGVEVDDIDAWTIAGVHSMSKNTSVYLGYNNQDDGNNTSGKSIDRDQFSLGMKHKF
jgi:predicted porin